MLKVTTGSLEKELRVAGVAGSPFSFTMACNVKRNT